MPFIFYHHPYSYGLFSNLYSLSKTFSMNYPIPIHINGKNCGSWQNVEVNFVVHGPGHHMKTYEWKWKLNYNEWHCWIENVIASQICTGFVHRALFAVPLNFRKLRPLFMWLLVEHFKYSEWNNFLRLENGNKLHLR